MASRSTSNFISGYHHKQETLLLRLSEVAANFSLAEGGWCSPAVGSQSRCPPTSRFPSMLLPRVCGAVCRDLGGRLKPGAVLPVDPRVTLELTAPWGELVSRREPEDGMEGLLAAPSHDPAVYLDNYCDAAGLQRCLSLIRKRGPQDPAGTELWTLQRNNFQPLTKHNNIERGVTPHFCNFVRNKSLQDRDDDSLSAGYAHSERRGVTPDRGNRRRLSKRSVTPGSDGRNSSLDDGTLSDGAESTQIQFDVPRIKVYPKHASSSDGDPQPARGGPPQAKPVSGSSTHPSVYDHNRTRCTSARKTSVKTGRRRKRHNAPAKRHTTTKVATEDKVPEDTTRDVTSTVDASTDVNVTSGRPRTAVRRVSVKKERRAEDRATSARESHGIPEEGETVSTEVGATVTEEEPHSSPVAPPPPPVRAPEPPKYNPRETTRPAQKPGYRSAISISGPPKAKQTVTDIIAEEIKQAKFYNFDIMADHAPSISQKSSTTMVTGGRLALSQQASRFELPMDMKVLETMTPVEYLSKYCVVTSKRQWLYEKIYLKNKDPKLGGLSHKGLEKALKEALVDTISNEEVSEMIEIAQITEATKIDQRLFVGIAAMTERMLYPRFLTEETQNIKDHKKERIECADFCGLEWKFNGVNVNPPIRKILESI